MKRFKVKRLMARPLQPWQLKLQRLLLSGQVKEHSGLYRIDVRHQDACAVWNGSQCDCSPYVAVDGMVADDEG